MRIRQAGRESVSEITAGMKEEEIPKGRVGRESDAIALRKTRSSRRSENQVSCLGEGE